MAFCGQISMHRPQRTHRLGRKPGSGHGCQLSGLWHHRHRNGQPLKNTVVRIPRPSWMAYLLMSNTHPDAAGRTSPHRTRPSSDCRFLISVTTKSPSDRDNLALIEHTGTGPGTQADRRWPCVGYTTRVAGIGGGLQIPRVGLTGGNWLCSYNRSLGPAGRLPEIGFVLHIRPPGSQPEPRLALFGATGHAAKLASFHTLAPGVGRGQPCRPAPIAGRT